MSSEPRTTADFIREIVAEDIERGAYDGRVQTRFPPEPNGFLHIGHVKAICVNFGIAEDFGGTCNLRFDDTNPVKEETRFVEAIQNDIAWLGFRWGAVYHASEYFEKLYALAEDLVRAGKAYVDDLTAEQIREYRGTLTEPGRESPYRDRSPDENLDLLRRMRAGEFPDGARVLRMKGDMASGNINLRDSVMYRILHAAHHQTGDTWCIYPTYDWAHGQSDALEGVTHSLCSLEFEDHRPLYTWYLEHLGIGNPRQIEFARLNLTYTVLSKRKLKALVEEKHVADWDDPRMPTIAGMRRRGYPAAALRDFCERIGVAKRNSLVDFAQLAFSVREALNRTAERVMVVLQPLKVVIVNYPEDRTEELDAVNNPEDPAAGTRTVPFGRELWIEADDFLEDPPKKFFRLAPGAEVRLKHAYFIRCEEVVKDAAGNVVELRCTYDPATRGGDSPDGRKVKGTLHWVSAAHAADAEVRLYDHLFTAEEPDAAGDFRGVLNPDSLTVLRGVKAEPGLAGAAPGTTVQFLRHGYFCVDPDSRPGRPVFNRTITLKDSWGRMQQAGKAD